MRVDLPKYIFEVACLLAGISYQRKRITKAFKNIRGSVTVQAPQQYDSLLVAQFVVLHTGPLIHHFRILIILLYL